MEAMISESLFEKQKSAFDMLNRNWVFILLFSDIILLLLICNNNNNNYSISVTIFDYNPKLSLKHLKHWILSCFAAKITKAATGGVL